MIEPKDFGLGRASLEKLRGGLPADNAALIREVLARWRGRSTVSNCARFGRGKRSGRSADCRRCL